MKKFVKGSLVVLALFLSGCSNKEDNSTEKKEKTNTVVIGSVGSDAQIWKFIAKSDLAKKENITIKVKEIEGGPQLNNATADGTVDVNAFQSLGYLISYNKDSNEKLVPVATTYLEPMGIYSEKYKSLDDVKDGATVAIADNPANTARALRLIEDAGLIKLSDDFNNGTGTPSDIIENPKKLEFKLIDDTTGPRILPDVDLVVIGNTVAFEGGLNVLTDSLYKERVNKNTKTSINALVTTKDKQDDKVIQKLANLYHSKEVTDYIKENFGGTKVDVQEDINKLWEDIQ